MYLLISSPRHIPKLPNSSQTNIFIIDSFTYLGNLKYYPLKEDQHSLKTVVIKNKFMILKRSIFNVLMTAGVYIRQLASSLPSLQSGSPSHLHFLCMHSPERHCISLDEHLAGGVGWRPQRDGDSSDWSCTGQRREFDHASAEKLQLRVSAMRFTGLDGETDAIDQTWQLNIKNGPLCIPSYNIC